MNNKIINFWLKEEAFSIEVAKERVKECIFVALNEDEIVGVCSGTPMYVDTLRDWFYYYRSYTKKDNRHEGLAKLLIKETCNYLNNNRIIDNKELNGVYIIFQNELLNKYVKEYITKDTRLIFLGFNDKDQQTRVFYFEDSKFED